MSRSPAVALFVVAFLMSFAGEITAQVEARTIMAEAPASTTSTSSASISPAALVDKYPENPAPRPRSRRVIDKKFVAVMGALGATESIRFTTRQLVLENEYTAGAPWVTSVPSHTHLVLKYAPIFGSELIVAYALKQPHEWLPGDRVIRKLWWVYPVAMAAIHLHNALGNINTQAPAGSGCTSVAQCEQP